MAPQVESLAYAGKDPWHGLGKAVQANLSPLAMQRAAGLDWTVEKVPLHYPVGAPTGQENPEWRRSGDYALVRSSDGRYLDTVKSTWRPVQNSEAFQFFDEFVRAGDLTMETAGSLAGGKWVFALAKARDCFHLARAKQDVTESYLLFTNPHAYGQSVDIRFTPVRVVCRNTLTLALGQKNNDYRVSFAHRRAFSPSLAQSLVRHMVHRLDDYRLQADYLAGRRYDSESVDRYFREVFKPTVEPRKPSGDVLPLTRNAARAAEIVETQPGHELAPGTWWNAFNAVTYLTDHEIGRSHETRLTTAWYGPGKARKVRGLNLAVEYAKAA